MRVCRWVGRSGEFEELIVGFSVLCVDKWS
jgi:hypothetical protein